MIQNLLTIGTLFVLNSTIYVLKWYGNSTESMDIQKILAQLDSQARNNDLRHKSKQLDDIFDEIEKALSAGLSHLAVINILNENGLEISLNTFRVTMTRLRKKRKSIAVIPVQQNEIKRGDLKENLQGQKTPREKPKTLAQIRAETDAFIKASEDKPSDAVQKRIDRLNKENAERLNRERSKNNAHSDS